MMSSPFISLLFVLPLALASSSPSTSCKGVADLGPTCKSVSEAHPGLPYDYCTSALSPSTAHHQLDLAGLAAAAAGLAASHADATEARIDDLADLEADEGAKKRLAECQDAFSDAGDLLKDAVDSINHRQYRKAPRILRASHGAVARCSEAFAGVQGASPPIYGSDDEYERLAKLAEAIVDMVHY